LRINSLRKFRKKVKNLEVDKFIVSSYAILANSDKMSQITFYDIKMYVSFSKSTFGAFAKSIKI